LLVLNYPDYVFERWHGTLLVFAVSAFSVLFNTFLAFTLPIVETIVLVVHLLGFFCVLVPLWVLAPVKGDAHTVFTQFNNYGGWNSNGTSALVGLLAAMIPLLGADAAVHMSEELRDASRNVARSMIWTTFVNGLTGWIMLITFCFCLGSLDDAIDTPTGYAFVEVFNSATGSTAGASTMSALVIFITIFCNVSIVATSSRQLFAFARDEGVPLSKWVAYVPRKPAVPVNAILVSFLVSCLLALINIGSTVAFNSIASLSLCAILASYVVSISCILLKRYR
jgi:choline transport protein